MDVLDILVLLDRSGSMEKNRSDHEGGLQSFVSDQQMMPGDVRLTFIQFDTQNPCEIVYDRTPIDQVGAITLIPRSGTPLLDAIGLGLAHLESRQRTDPSTKTVVMIVTDGEENSSREWTVARVKARITDLEAQGWSFLFLGANIDSFAEAGSLGMAPANVLQYQQNHASAQAMYATISNKMSGLRSASARGMSLGVAANALAFTDDDRVAVEQGVPVAYDGGASALQQALQQAQNTKDDDTQS